MKSAYLTVIVAVLAVALGYWGISGMVAGPDIQPGNSSCSYSQLNYYFRESCHYCQQVSGDGSLEKLEDLGVKVDRLEVVNWGMWGIYQTPTFEFGGQRVAGYKSFQELRQLLGCNT